MSRELTILNIHKGIAFKTDSIATASKFLGISEPTLRGRLTTCSVTGIGQYIVMEPRPIKYNNLNTFNYAQEEPE